MFTVEKAQRQYFVAALFDSRIVSMSRHNFAARAIFIS